MTPRHEQARALAQAGIPVFPCEVNGKRPATPNGFKDATADLETIDAWWGAADYNVALCPEDAGWFVVDLDPGAEEPWIALLAKHGGHAATYEVETPRGGRHLYFNGSLPSSAGKLAPHIDTRGRGGYVLVPPSVVDGKEYTVSHDREIASAPSWVKAAFAARDHRVEPGAGAELDTPAALIRARGALHHYINRGHVAISGQGGNDLTYRVAAEVRDYGISDASCLGLLLERWNDYCQPPWSVDELREIVAHAYKYAQNGEEGAWATRSLDEAFRDANRATAPAPKASRYKPRRLAEFRQQTPIEWIVPDMIPARSTVLLIAPPRSYKSFFSLDIFLREAAKGHIVYYAAGEGLHGIEMDRSKAWQAANNVPDEKLANTFRTTRTPPLGFPGEAQDFIDALRADLEPGENPRLIVLDTVARVMGGLDENKSADVGILTKFAENLIEAFGCAVVLVHHMSDKPGGRERGARGSSAFSGNVDVILEMNRIEGEARAVEVWVRKQKDAPERGTPWTYRLMKVGDSLVILPTVAAEHAAAREEAQTFTRRKVQRALYEAQATPLRPMSTEELLVNLCGPGAHNDRKLTRELNAFGKKECRDYCNDDGEGVFWYLRVLGGMNADHV